MFYQQLIALCEREEVKPTPFIKSLGFSAGNLKRWENGATVNSDILLAISEHFKVSIDYLLTGKEFKVSSNVDLINSNETTMINLFRMLSEKEQDRIIGRLENMVEESQESKNKDVV